MRWINTDRRALPTLAEIAGISYTNTAQLIAEQDDHEVIAVGIYDQYNGHSIHSHIWIAPGRRPSRVWWWAMHDYPLWQLGVTKIIATILSSNRAVMKVAGHLGYKLVGTIPDYAPDGSDLMIYVGVEEDATFWHKFRDGRANPPTYRNRGLQEVA